MLVHHVGWPALTFLQASWPPMSVSAAASFGLAGAALALRAYGARTWAAHLRLALAAALCAVNLAIALVFVFPALWPGPAEWLPRTGSLAPTTIYALFVLGVTIACAEQAHEARRGRQVQAGTAMLGAAGAIGVLSYMMSMDYLYIDAQFARMSLEEALGLCVAAAGLWCVWREADWNNVEPGPLAVHEIVRTSDALLSVIVGGVAIIVFGLSQHASVNAVASQMQLVQKDRLILFNSVLRSRLEQVEQLRTRPAIIAFVSDFVRRPQHSDMSTLAPLRTSVNSIIGRGISAFAYVGTNQERLASAGHFTAPSSARFPIAGQNSAELVWDKGFVLRTRAPLRDAAGLLAYIEVEQALPDLTAMHAEGIAMGRSGDLVVCTQRGAGLLCFPTRHNAGVVLYPGTVDGNFVPAMRALMGETATIVTVDVRRQSVMAAFGPIGSSGLAMVTKMDMWELYAPVRRQFFFVLPFLLALLGGSIWLMRARLQPLIKALDDARAERAFQAQHDPLTGLPNRQMFAERLHQALMREHRSHSSLALLYLDLNEFKSINDTLGHQAGDAVLRWFARHLEASVRETDTVARLGGDEFTIILESMTSADDAARIARNIELALAAPGQTMPDPRLGTVSASIGIALFEPGMDADALMARADEDMYRNKLAKRDSARAPMHAGNILNPGEHHARP